MALTITKLKNKRFLLNVFSKKQCFACIKNRTENISIHANENLSHKLISCHFDHRLFTKRFHIRTHPPVIFNQHRRFSAHNQDVHLVSTDPFALVQDDINTICDEINKELVSHNEELGRMARYHFDGKGKALRPMLTILVARACNMHNTSESMLKYDQKRVGLIAEMIHTASLVHDDVIDASNTRRGKPSVHHEWGQRKAIMTGDFILSVSSQMLARIRSEEVVIVLSKVLEDLVRGEFMQLGSKEDEGERFHHYLKKTYKKTASLIANSCKAVAILGECEDSVVEIAFQYGKNTGIAFQLVDDLLDFTSCDQVMGKPTAADLKLGLATAPVLYAAHQFPELQSMIMRRFSEEGDVETTRHLVAKSKGVEQTRALVDSHCKEAIRLIRELRPSSERSALIKLTDIIRNREK